jgi:hypothetical protein
MIFLIFSTTFPVYFASWSMHVLINSYIFFALLEVVSVSYTGFYKFLSRLEGLGLYNSRNLSLSLSHTHTHTNIYKYTYSLSTSMEIFHLIGKVNVKP